MDLKGPGPCFFPEFSKIQKTTGKLWGVFNPHTGLLQTMVIDLNLWLYNWLYSLLYISFF